MATGLGAGGLAFAGGLGLPRLPVGALGLPLTASGGAGGLIPAKARSPVAGTAADAVDRLTAFCTLCERDCCNMLIVALTDVLLCFFSFTILSCSDCSSCFLKESRSYSACSILLSKSFFYSYASSSFFYSSVLSCNIALPLTCSSSALSKVFRIDSMSL